MNHILIKNASEFEMMWAFFGTTKTYPIIIGFLQIIGGTLLLFRKTKLIGALFLTPVFINIILLDILYKVPLGALVNALFIQFVLIFIIFQQRRKIQQGVKILLINQDGSISFKNSAMQFLVANGLAAILLIISVN